VADGVQLLQGGLHIGASLKATGTVWMTGGNVHRDKLPDVRRALTVYGLITVSTALGLAQSMLLGLYAARELRDSYGVVTQPAQPSHGGS